MIKNDFAYIISFYQLLKYNDTMRRMPHQLLFQVTQVSTITVFYYFYRRIICLSIHKQWIKLPIN